MMETLYSDFTTKLLPKIQEGLVIGKEYFLDLFGRYVKFLFIVDVISAILYAIGSGLSIYAIFKLVKWANREDEWDNPGAIMGCFICGMLGIMFFMFSVSSTINAIKDKYIPEVRVMEKLNIIKSD